MNNKLYFIDPRGYFGNSLLYGLKEYDYAKVIYALTGYDNFNNNNEFFVDINDDNISFDIKNYMDINLNIRISDKIKAWVVIMWLGLAQYNSNNIIKCITSYYNAFYWYDKFFN